MTTVGHTRPHRSAAAAGTVDIAGTAWPLYKLEALGAGLLVFLTVLTVTQTLQPAVLAAAAATVVVWWARRLQHSDTTS